MSVQNKPKKSLSLFRKRSSEVSNRNAQLEYLSHAVFLEEAENPKLIRRATQVIMATIILFLGWAAVTPVDELSSGMGEIVPSGKIQKVQHYEGGIIEEIYVEDGQFVDKGTVLLSLSSIGAEADLDAMRVDAVALMLESERLRAYTENRDVDFKAFEKDYPRLVADHKKILSSTRLDVEQQFKILDQKVKQEEEKITGLENRINIAKEKINIAKDGLEINEGISKKGHNSKVAYLNARKEYARAKDGLMAIQSNIKVRNEVLSQAKSERDQVETRLNQEAYNSLAEVEREYSSIVEKIRKFEDRSLRLDIVSPARGIVKGLNATTIGAVVPPGGEVAEIVPVDQSLIVEAKLSTRDIGHVRVGQDVNVKVDSYDFSRYGGVKGTLKKISATTFRDKKTNEPYYKGVVELSQNYVGQSVSRNPILPGMTVQADVITGEKSVMAYLLKPVALAADMAFSER